MNIASFCFRLAIGFALFFCTGGCGGTTKTNVTKAESSSLAKSPETAVKKAEREVENHYSKAHPEIQEYVLWTARSFGPGGMWLPEDNYSDLSGEAREKKIRYLATLFNEAEYGRHLCAGLAEAGALKGPRLVPGLMKVAGYHVAGQDYDCRPKWMAVAALARQQSDEAVPLLISLVDHGNQNTRNWARAALSRQMGQDFKQDKHAWAQWWREQGHNPIDSQFLKPYELPAQNKK